ncbi:ABC transporter permease [Modestobacter sp. VKM Ac-2979]|uniref:ABC transporter permease n=1 Tax=unclassified Modestobacter TaxID=2643866 RepID=UPI0022ABB93D|nr:MULTISPECIES: ABC transporter permease [unclassified Modestobacter]MCZ2812009.1 ABC transporter permease [Modestobacter sp. VKM Ac-2979]MCZ2843733.1 ABC transporter permease [Modestobacter sp. VKM Ac-2980]
MGGAVVRRVGQAGVSAAGGAIVVFPLLVLAPGDPARRVLTARGIQDPSPAAVAAVRDELRLDDPLPQRFWEWLTSLLRGDLGVSWRTGRPVTEEFLERLPATAILTTAGLLLAVVLSLALGLLAAARPGGWSDHLARVLSTAVLVVPGFLLGVVLLDLVVVEFGLGRVIADGTWATVFLPALVLGLGAAATWSRVLRAGLLEARGAAYLRVSRARGAGLMRRLLGHELPNALPPYLTMVGLGSAALLGGAPIVETVFTWPGVGRFTVEAITARDMPVVTGFTIIAVLVYVVVSLGTDLLTAALDPRLRPASDPGARRPAPARGAA